MSFLCCEKIDPTSLNGASFENDNLGTENQVLTVLTTPGDTIGWRDQQPATKIATTDANAPVVLTKNIPSASQVLTALSATSAKWQTIVGVPDGNNQFGVWNKTNFEGNGVFDSTNDNYAIGLNSLKMVTPTIGKEGKNNIGFGTNTLTNNTLGFNNIAIGFEALKNNKDGDDNIAIGISALLNNTETANIALGNGALLSNISGSFNCAIGSAALQNNGGGSSNTALGANALTGISSGSLNTAIGNNAGPATDETGTIAIGFGATPTSSAHLALGGVMDGSGTQVDTTIKSDAALAIVIAGFPNLKGYYIPLYNIP